jgi:hypothetical protein
MLINAQCIPSLYTIKNSYNLGAGISTGGGAAGHLRICFFFEVNKNIPQVIYKR